MSKFKPCRANNTILHGNDACYCIVADSIVFLAVPSVILYIVFGYYQVPVHRGRRQSCCLSVLWPPVRLHNQVVLTGLKATGTGAGKVKGSTVTSAVLSPSRRHHHRHPHCSVLGGSIVYVEL